MATRPNHPESPPGEPPVVASADTYLISVQIDPAYAAALDLERLHSLAGFVLQAEGRRAALELGITITSDEEIHKLNKQYLGHDYPTDVLSFGAEGAEHAGGAPEPEHGDKGAELDVVPATEYVTEGYEGDVEESGAALPLAAPDPAEAGKGTASDSAQASAIRFVTPPDWPAYLGDIVISYDTAAAQAADFGHDAAAEVDVLLVHGLLHLLGHDDHAPADRARMHRRQDDLLAAFS